MAALAQPVGNASCRYDLLARLAQGGMAEIFLARAHALAGFERYVVLKRIRPEHGDDARWINMFLDEARLAAQLQHPNIAQVFDLGQIGGDYFYTMEYVHGADVLDILTRCGELGSRVPLGVALAIIAGAAAGLAHAHVRCGANGKPLGIVHRDVSPSNLMVSHEGGVKVVDFGVAKARQNREHTQAGTIMGKVAYLSPEQCKTGAVDHRSDIFSLGTVLYEILTHQRLFKRDTDYETLAAVVRFTPTRPSFLVPGLPRDVDHLVMRALAKDPAQRFQSATEMVEAIEAIAESQGLSMTPSVLRRFMSELWGDQPEPWRRHREDEKSMHTEVLELSHAFPINATATEVPLIAKTSMLDLDKLFPVTRSVSIALPEPVAASQPAPALSVSAVQPVETLAEATRVDPTPSRPHSRSTPPPLPVRKPTVQQTAVINKPSRRLPSWLTVSATAVIVLVLGLGGYLLLAGDVEQSTGAAFQIPAIPKPPPPPPPAAVAPAPPPAAPPAPEVDPNITLEPFTPATVAPRRLEAPAPAQKTQTPCTDPLDCQF
jgi:serine/threonine-protein kinase